VRRLGTAGQFEQALKAAGHEVRLKGEPCARVSL
jgi:hypothetical protein